MQDCFSRIKSLSSYIEGENLHTTQMPVTTMEKMPSLHSRSVTGRRCLKSKLRIFCFEELFLLNVSNQQSLLVAEKGSNLVDR